MDHLAMTLKEKRDRLVEDLGLIEDPQERLGYIIDLGKHAPGLADEYKEESFRIEGCISNLWLYPSFEKGICRFQADSDAMITKGLSTLLCNLYSGHCPAEILEVDPSFLAQVGITQHLSPNRRNGLTQIGNRIMGYARLHLNS